MTTPKSAAPTAQPTTATAAEPCASKKPKRKLSLEITELDEVLERKISPASC